MVEDSDSEWHETFTELSNKKSGVMIPIGDESEWHNIYRLQSVHCWVVTVQAIKKTRGSDPMGMVEDSGRGWHERLQGWAMLEVIISIGDK